MEQQNSEVARIESEVAKAREEESERSAQIAAAEKKLEEIEAQYELKSVEAHNYGNELARKWLQTADRDARAARGQIKQLDSALREIRERVVRLERDKADTERGAKLAECAEEERNLIYTDALSIDDGVARLVLNVRAAMERRENILRLNRELGRETPVRVKYLEARLKCWLNVQVFGRDPTVVTADARRRYEQPFSKFLEDAVRDGSGESSEVIYDSERDDRADLSKRLSAIFSGGET